MNTDSQHTSLDYINTVKDNIIKPKFRIYILSENETIKYEITDDFIDGSGSLSINYQQGQRRSFNFSLKNIDSKYTPNPNGLIWIGTKFRLDLGIECKDGYVFWQENGIFVISDPQAIHAGSDKKISIQCYDKFSLLDGTLGGNIDATYTVPSNTNVKSAIKDILLLKMSQYDTRCIDSAPLKFDELHDSDQTPYTITKSANGTLGDILIELANMISCDIFYDEYGSLNVKSGVEDISNSKKPILWRYSDIDLEYLEGTTSYNFAGIKNVVIVVGANVNNGVIYSAKAENNNLLSPTSISKIGSKIHYIEDSNIYSNILARDRAEYELNKMSMLKLSISISSTYMIHLDVNNCISISDSHFDFYDSKFVIQSINIPIGIDSKISIKCTNISSLPFYSNS